MQLSKDGKRYNTHTGQSEMEKQAFRHRMSLLPSNWICQSSIETHAVTNIIILQSGKTGSAWQNNTALKLPRNQQTSVASFTYVAEGHRLPLQMKERCFLHRTELNWFVLHLIRTASFELKDCCCGHDGRILSTSKTALQAPHWLQGTRQRLMMFASSPLEPLFPFPSMHLQVFEANATNRSDKEHKAPVYGKNSLRKNQEDTTLSH